MAWCSVSGNAGIVLFRCGEEGAELEGSLIYQSICVPALTYGHKLWVVTEEMRLRIQAAEMSFLRGWLGSVLEMG